MKTTLSKWGGYLITGIVLLAVTCLGTGCAGLGHRNGSDDKEFNTNGKIIEFGKAGRFTLFGYYNDVKRTTDERALSGASGVFADKTMQGFRAKTTGIKGGEREYGIESYESKIRADAITAALEPVRGIVSDVVRLYLAGPLGDVWAGAATTEEKLTKSIEVAKEDEKAPEGTVDELKKALEKLK